MYYYNYNENAFTPYPPVPEKIVVDGKEVDNPEFLSLNIYTETEVIEIIKNANENGKIMQPFGNTFMLVDKPAPTAKEQAEQRISELKANLFKTDYQAIKYAEGEISEEDYAGIKEQRKKWRSEINVLEEKIASQQ